MSYKPATSRSNEIVMARHFFPLIRRMKWKPLASVWKVTLGWKIGLWSHHDFCSLQKGKYLVPYARGKLLCTLIHALSFVIVNKKIRTHQIWVYELTNASM